MHPVSDALGFREALSATLQQASVALSLPTGNHPCGIQDLLHASRGWAHRAAQAVVPQSHGIFECIDEYHSIEDNHGPPRAALHLDQIDRTPDHGPASHRSPPSVRRRIPSRPARLLRNEGPAPDIFPLRNPIAAHAAAGSSTNHPLTRSPKIASPPGPIRRHDQPLTMAS